MMVAFVAIASQRIPVGWTVPPGWKQVGVTVAGAGTSHVLASGVWYKTAGPSEPTPQQVIVNMSGAGSTKIQATVLSVSDPYAFPGGLDIRRNNRSMPRGLIEADSAVTVGPVDSAAMPFVASELLDVPMQAGRSYRISYRCPAYQFAVNNTGCRFRLTIERNGTAFYHVMARMMATSGGGAGTERNAVYGEKIYVPPTDEASDWRVRIINEASPAGHNVTLFSPHGLEVEDVGAVF